ncbi:MAG: hypothetical protein ABSC87_08990 [Halobacteriota archaeon]|jgi:hypothetical protein
MEKKNTGAKKMLSGLTTCSEELTVCPVADDTERYQKRPNGASQRVYSVLEKEGYPDGWQVLCMVCYRERRDQLLSKGET